MSPVHPTRSISLGTVRRDVDEIPPHPPDDVVMQLVQQAVRAFEPAGALHVGVVHATYDVAASHRRPKVTGPPVHLDVAKTVQGETWLPFLDRDALPICTHRWTWPSAGDECRCRHPEGLLQ